MLKKEQTRSGLEHSVKPLLSLGFACLYGNYELARSAGRFSYFHEILRANKNRSSQYWLSRGTPDSVPVTGFIVILYLFKMQGNLKQGSLLKTQLVQQYM